jgi:hypothetical protein
VADGRLRPDTRRDRAGGGPTKADAPIAVRIEAGSPGAKIDRNIFGQFAEHLGSGIYGGVWVGKDSTIPNTAASAPTS